MKIHTVEQRSPEWYALRAGMPTASEFSKLITSSGEVSKTLQAYALTLAGEKFAGKPLDAFEGTQWTERGKELEAEATRLYQFDTDTTVQPVGFITDDEQTHGCSPDGLVNDDGMVEFKCLKAENHIKAILYFQKNGTCQTDYIQQTQGQLMIAGRQWCDLIFYHPDLPMLTIRQTPNSALFAALEREIKSVCRERDKVLAAIQEQANPQQKAA